MSPKNRPRRIPPAGSQVNPPAGAAGGSRSGTAETVPLEELGPHHLGRYIEVWTQLAMFPGRGRREAGRLGGRLLGYTPLNGESGRTTPDLVELVIDVGDHKEIVKIPRMDKMRIAR